ncbi:MAG TPA: ABC transporter substrate-binding protein [Nitrososphaerales archaeon]|nr:ABC transporter substrate-binding protein [Nitrososphaerales archaeon]
MRNGKSAISTTLAVAVIVILVVAVGAAVYLYSSTSSKSTTTSSSGVTTSAPTTVPTTFTYEEVETAEFLDPAISYFSFDYNVMQNVYEPILWFNGTCGTCVIPWLAQSYTSNSAGTVYSFTLRQGIKFADGEPLNSTAVYFAINRGLLFDGSTPVGHGTQSSWLIQQLENDSLSTFMSGVAQSYSPAWEQAVLAQNMIQVTGPLTFKVNVQNPNSAFAFLFANPIVDPVAPVYTMQHDLAMWNQTSAGYKLPFSKLSGGLNQEISQYFQDLVATCNAGNTPAGCGATYLSTAAQGSMAGTGPYVLTSNDVSKNVITLTANPNYWGGPYKTPIKPQIQTVVFKYVPDENTREIDLQNAAKSGQAMSIDVASTSLYDIADRAQWLNSNKLVSDITGVTMYGPYNFYGTTFDPFDTNVTSPLTGAYYSFQPFADQRIRLAFADAVNMTSEWLTTDNKVGTVAQNVVPPGLPPSGSFNSSIKPAYSYNPDQSAQLLLQAMQNPITKFTFTNGTAAPAGLFNNAFGCKTLTSGRCTNPVQQSITLVYGSGDTVDESIMNDLAGTIDNISATYNMGLTVSVEPLPTGQMLTEAFAVPGHLYFYALGWIDDYPWVTDFTGNMLAYPGTYPASDGWNIGQMNTLFQKSLSDSAANNLPALVSDSNAMDSLSNSMVMYLWTYYNVNFVAMTSNVQGLFWNPSLGSAAAGGVGPEYFATLY